MRIRLLDAAAVSLELIRLLEEHAHIDIAVAWAAMTDPARALLANKGRLRSLLIGIDFAATDPDLIDLLVGVRNAFVAAGSRGCFHPKIYYFETQGLAEAIVGSANLTPGGVGSNHEACVHLAGDRRESIFKDVRRQLKDYSQLSIGVQKGPPIGVQKGPPSSSGVTDMMGAPFALLAA